MTVRLLDPPLHEFLPHSPEEMQVCAACVGRVVRHGVWCHELSEFASVRVSKLLCEINYFGDVVRGC